MLMYDYRKDVIELMAATENTPESLMQSKVALTMLINALGKEETDIDSETIKKERKIGNEYRVQRMLSGARVLDEENEQVTFFNERKIHSSDWHTGDKVFLNQKADGEYDVEKIVPQNANDDGITEFSQAVVERDFEIQKLYISKNISGNRLFDENVAVNRFYPTDEQISKLRLEEKDIVDLAWYQRTPEYITIRWKYDVEPETVEEKKNATVKKVKKTSEAEKSTLKFDLEGKTVALIVGDPKSFVSDGIRKMIEEHDGALIELDAFKRAGRQSYFDKKFDLAVTVQTLNSHETSEVVMKMLNDENVPRAIATTCSVQAVERAVYRALKGLPAYETTTVNIDYPVK